MWEVIVDNLPTLITLAIGVAIIWKHVSKLLAVVQELHELLNAVIVALSDKKLTKEEIDTIIKEAKDIPKAVKDLFKKQ